MRIVKNKVHVVVEPGNGRSYQLIDSANSLSSDNAVGKKHRVKLNGGENGGMFDEGLCS